MRFYDALKDNPTRSDLNRVATMAVGRLALSVGLALSGERIAALVQSIQGRGFSIRQIEDACVELAVCAKFSDKLRFGGTITPADILEKAREAKQTPREAMDPVRAMRMREATRLANLLPESPNARAERLRMIREQNQAT